MSFAANLRRIRKEAGMTQEQLALRAGFPGQSRVANYEKGIREPDFEDLRMLALALNTDEASLLGKAAFSKEYNDWEPILAYAQAASLGDGAEPDEYAETHKLMFRSSSLRKKNLRPDHTGVFYGKGDSMEPRIHEGDAILFDKRDTKPRDGEIYVITMGGHLYAKRAMVLDDVVYFRSDNPDGDHAWRKPRRMDDRRDPITIVGRVRWIGSWEG